MKILVPTDFSECADFALNAACQFALIMDSDITLFHVADLPDEFGAKSSDDSLAERVQERMKNNIDELMSQREAMAGSVGVKLHKESCFGSFTESLIDYDKEHQFDLVVMGSYGASGKQEWFIGSNTQKLVRKLRKNILVIKNPISNLRFNKVMFPSNLTETDREAFVEFLEFLKIFKTKEVHILAVNTSGWFNQPTPIMLELLKDFKALATGDYDCQTHYYSDYSVEAGIRHFAEKYEIDLVGISNIGRSPIKRLFQGSNVEMLINHSEIPILVIDNKK